MPVPGRGGAGNGARRACEVSGGAGWEGGGGPLSGHARPALRVAPLSSQRRTVAPDRDSALGLEAENRNLKTRKLTGWRPSWCRGNEGNL